jgi:multiple sugar transport system ATP-binding protein
VFQSYALYPHMTVYENMAFGLRNRKMPEAEIKERVTKAAKMLDIVDYLDRKPKQMSGGQRQRVALGRALVRDPKVFLLDEPLSNLDAKLRATMRSEITALHKSLKTTFIYVTHDQVEAMTMGTRIVVMKLGCVQQIDTPMNLYNSPYNKFVAGFIGTPQMNFFDVTLKRYGDGVAVGFSNGDGITVPYEAVSKIDKGYLEGGVPVIFGIRPEHIEINRDGDGLKFIVTGVERLGNETILYGKLGDSMGEFSVKDDGNSIIVKLIDRDDIAVGDVVYAQPKHNKLHFFDKETEITLIHKIPLYNTVAAQLGGGRLAALGKETALPEAIGKHVSDGAVDLIVPPKAIVKGGDFSLRVAKIEDVDGEKLAYLQDGDHYLFALVGEGVSAGDDYGFSLLYDKITVRANGEELVSPISDEVSLEGRFSKKETRENGERVLHFYYNIGNYSVETVKENGYKINSIDKDHCYDYTYRYVIDRDNIRTVTDGGDGLDVTVEEKLDYIGVCYAKVRTDEGQTFLIKVDRDFDGGRLRVAFDGADVSVYSTKIDMKLC